MRFLVLWMILLASVCHGQKALTKADSLSGLYKALDEAEGPDMEKVARLFFKTFPGTFPEFVRLYGFTEITGDSVVFGPLYSESWQVAYFMAPRYAISEKLFSKIVGIAIGGRWQADNVSLFQHRLRTFMLYNTAEFVSILQKYKPQEIRSFFYFLYDGPHPNNPTKQEEVRKLRASLKKIDLAMEILLAEEFRKVERAWASE